MGGAVLNIFQLVSVSLLVWIPDHSAVFKNWPDQGQVGCSSAFFWTGPQVFFSAGRGRSSPFWWWFWHVQTRTDSWRARLQGRGLVGLVSRSGYPGSIGGMTCCIDSWCSISWRWTSSPTVLPISPTAVGLVAGWCGLGESESPCREDNLPVEKTIIYKETHLWSDSTGKIVDMAQEQQGIKHIALGYSRVHGCLTGELAINHHSHLALCEEVHEPLVQGSFDAILF